MDFGIRNNLHLPVKHLWNNRKTGLDFTAVESTEVFLWV